MGISFFTNLNWLTLKTAVSIGVVVGLAIAGYLVLAFIEKRWPFNRKKRRANL